MCGIFGYSIQKNNVSFKEFEKNTKFLYKISELRGQDSSGISILCDQEILTHKEVIKPSLMIKRQGFNEALANGFTNSSNRLSIIGHCRLVTNGSFLDNNNNHPIDTSNFVGVHNGIVLNAESFSDLNTQNLTTREHFYAYNDTKSFFSKIDELTNRFKDIKYALSQVFDLIDGSASIALLDNKTRNILLATNTGSLHYILEEGTGNFVFASEHRFLKDFVNKSQFIKNSCSIIQLKPGQCLEIGETGHKLVELKGLEARSDQTREQIPLPNLIIQSDVSQLKRCTHCILPRTYPFIEFDENGVCNFCRRFEHQQFYGKEKLEELLENYRSKDGTPDCLVGLSGGRDSCYGLHILKEEFGMTPITYTYDWGLTTDISRRNQAKIVGKLGIEHIIRSANIQKKRRHIQKNINAWLKHPQMGMVPLFMSGDKDFYQYGRTLRKQLNLELTVFCAGHLLEQSEYFVGFCGVNQNVASTARTYSYNTIAKLQLALYYVGQFLRNPFYINESVFDSIRSFFTTFLFKDDYLYLFEYLHWEEKKIEALLKKEYDWESDTTYGKNQWRMGDGQTAFTNYIWYTVAGFSEFDNFRSNQIREGLLTREQALELSIQDNRPKIETLQYFSYLVGFNLDAVLAEINSIPKLY